MQIKQIVVIGGTMGNARAMFWPGTDIHVLSNLSTSRMAALDSRQTPHHNLL